MILEYVFQVRYKKTNKSIGRQGSCFGIQRILGYLMG